MIPETTDSGWTAFAGGSALPALAANGAFLAVRVPAGETEIVCRCLPPGLRTGAAANAASAAILGLLALATVRRGARSSSRSS